jgi:transposase
MIVGVVLDSEGYLVCCEIWPGNTADVTSLKAVAGHLKKRFGIHRMCVVADRGLISQETVDELKCEGIHDILGVRMRRNKDIDENKIADDARYDGKWVLTTDTDMKASQVALKYKQLLMVERIFRDIKSALETRPIFHKCDETIRGHVFCAFLGLVLRKELDQALDAMGQRFEWEDIKRDLKALQDITIYDGGKTITIRSRVEGCGGKVFQAVGVAIPATIRMP